MVVVKKGTSHINVLKILDGNCQGQNMKNGGNKTRTTFSTMARTKEVVIKKGMAIRTTTPIAIRGALHAMSRSEAAPDDNVVTGTILVNSKLDFILFDSRASYYFISHSFIEK